jgi:hypothetical protein
VLTMRSDSSYSYGRDPSPISSEWNTAWFVPACFASCYRSSGSGRSTREMSICRVLEYTRCLLLFDIIVRTASRRGRSFRHGSVESTTSNANSSFGTKSGQSMAFRRGVRNGAHRWRSRR